MQRDNALTQYTLRNYQKEASDKAVEYFRAPHSDNGIIILPTGSGKSHVISDIANELGQPVLILQPTKEILQQNYEKYLSYGLEASIYSASFNKKEISNVTFAMIGSVMSKNARIPNTLSDIDIYIYVLSVLIFKELFGSFKYVIIDEANYCNPKKGMYKEFIENTNAKVIGLTATPIRLSTDGFGGSILKFITRTRPRIFKDIIYYAQIKDLLNQGYLSKIQYETDDVFDRLNVKLNSTGADFNELSLQKYCEEIQQNNRVISAVNNNLHRKGIIGFVPSIKDAKYISMRISNSMVVTSKTKKKERDDILKRFRSGNIKAIINVGVLAIGFDYPELDTIVMATPTMSLARYYQIIGRGIRPHINKEYCLVIDLTDNYKKFGKIEDLVLNENNGKPFISSGTKQLTNVYFSDNKKIKIKMPKTYGQYIKMPFGKYKGEEIGNIEIGYLKWLSEKCDLSGQLKKDVLRAVVAYEAYQQSIGRGGKVLHDELPF